MRILYESETGNIVAYGTYIEAGEGQSILSFDGDIDISECRVVKGKMVRMTKIELDERQAKLNEVKKAAKVKQEELIEDLVKHKGVFEDDSNSAKDRISALVEYLKTSGIIK